jgi:hypothetical protein
LGSFGKIPTALTQFLVSRQAFMVFGKVEEKCNAKNAEEDSLAFNLSSL